MRINIKAAARVLFWAPLIGIAVAVLILAGYLGIHEKEEEPCVHLDA